MLKIRTLLFLLIIILPLNSLTLRTDEIIVKFSEKDSIIAQNIIESFSKILFQFQKKIGQYPDLPVEIILTENDSTYLHHIKKVSSIIEFSNAHYNRKTGQIFIRNPRNQKNFVQLDQILLHEYIHHFIHNQWPDAPLWFHEGMAVYFSGDLTFDRELNFIKNYLFGNTSTLNQMKYRYPENRIQWEAFYAKSALAVKYLYQKKRNEFYQLWNYSDNRSFEYSFRLSFLMKTEDFSNAFEKYSADHFKMEMLLASSSILWGFLPFILLIGWIRRTIKNRKIKKEWIDENSDDDEINFKQINDME